MATTELAIGTILRDRYRIEAKIGRGGFGTTYRAVDLERFDEPRVIKRLHANLDRPERARALFEREGRVLAILAHPLIPHLHHFFEQDGEFHLVEDYIEGETWDRVIKRRGPIREEEAVGVALDVLDVLTYLHGRDPAIIHRDIKPSNIIRRTSDGRTLLLDFGAVREVLELESRTVMGTRGFAPPEQAKGEPVAASDLYALGATLLQLLTDRPPDSWHDLNTGKIKIDGRVPGSASFSAIIEKLFAPMEHRYQSAAHVRRDLLEMKAATTNSLQGAGATAAPPVDDDATVSDERGLGFPPPLAATTPNLAPPSTPIVKRAPRRTNRPLVLTLSAVGVVALSLAGVKLFANNNDAGANTTAAADSLKNRPDSAALAAELTGPWSVAKHATLAGPTLEFVFPSSWAVDTTPAMARAPLNFRSIEVHGDSDAVRVRLPASRGVFMAAFNKFPDKSVSAHEVVLELSRHLFGGSVSATKPEDLGNGVWQSALQVGGNKYGFIHVAIARDAGGALVLSRTFLGDDKAEQRAIKMVLMDSLRVR